MRFIADQGVKHVFLVTGGGAMHLNDALARCSDLTFVCNHHEQASAIAAENYSKATNNLGVALVTTGPGGTNAITGVAGAWLDSTPTLFISGQVKRADRMYRPDGTHLGLRQKGPQEVDIVSLVKPITKYAVTVEDPQSIRYHLEKATYLARTGRPGPVWIDIPIDVQAMAVEPDSMPGFDPAELMQESQTDWVTQLREVMERLSRAERPFIFAGNGVRVSRAAAAFEKLVCLLNIPVGLTWMAMDLLDDDDPLFVGRPGTVASRGANFALQNADFVLVIGARLDPPLMGWDPRQFARGAYKAVVDIDPAELQKLEGVIDNPICADALSFIEAMLRQGSSAVHPGPQRLDQAVPGVEGALSHRSARASQPGTCQCVSSGRDHRRGSRARTTASFPEAPEALLRFSCWPIERGKDAACFTLLDWGQWDSPFRQVSACVWVVAARRQSAWTAMAASNLTSRSWRPSPTSTCPSSFSFSITMDMLRFGPRRAPTSEAPISDATRTPEYLYLIIGKSLGRMA